MEKPVRIVSYDPAWPQNFQTIGAALRGALGDTALRIDHIGSTSVAGLAAKPIIDIQISVLSFEPLDAIVKPIEGLGYQFNPHNSDLIKRYFGDPPDHQNVHIHVRVAGFWSEQFALLFRDYLRTHPEDAAAYGQLKQTLASNFGNDREGYTDAKTDFIFVTIAKAHVWSMETGWTPGPSDA